MNLQQTVSKILGKEVSLEEAMTFANEQYGTLCAYNKEFEQKVNPKKEVRAYVLPVSVDSDFEIHGNAIQNWLSYEEIHGKLSQDAEKFISLCEESGDVHTLYGFVSFLNFDTSTINVGESWFYITDKY